MRRSKLDVTFGEDQFNLGNTAPYVCICARICSSSCGNKYVGFALLSSSLTEEESLSDNVLSTRLVDRFSTRSSD